MDITVLLLLMLLMTGNCNNNDNRGDDERDRSFFEDNFTTPFRAARRSACNLETLTFILLFFYVNEINAPIAAVPVGAGNNPFFERFERFEGEGVFEFER